MAGWTAAGQRRAWADPGQRVPMLICRRITREQQRALIEEARAARLKGQALLTPISGPPSWARPAADGTAVGPSPVSMLVERSLVAARARGGARPSNRPL